MTDVETLRALLARVEEAITDPDFQAKGYPVARRELEQIAALLRAKIAETEHAG